MKDKENQQDMKCGNHHWPMMNMEIRCKEDIESLIAFHKGKIAMMEMGIRFHKNKIEDLEKLK